MTRPVTNFFSAPADDVDVVTQAIFGTNVEVLEEKGEWVRLRTPDRYTGWAQRAHIVPAKGPYGGTGAVEVVSLFAHLYRDKSITRHAPLLTVPFESRLEPAPEAESDERWLGVRLPDGRSAWVQRGDVAEPGRLTRDAMVALSRRFLGLPYTWGGTSSFGYDCSGFTQMLIRRLGMTMPRDAHQQEAWEGLAPVAKEDLQPGDLLFFGSQEGKVTHTGMYIGSREFIHATTHEKPVSQISRVDDEHWTAVFLSARRLK